MNAPLRPALFALAMGATLAVPLSAQSSYYGPLVPIPVDDGVGSRFQRADAGNLFAYGRPSAVVLDGASVFVLPNPMVFRDSALMPGSASDFVVLPGGAPEGHDAVVVADPGQGLALRSFGWTDQEFQESWISTAAKWRSIRRLEVADLDRDGDLDIAGLRGDGEAIELKLRNGNGWTDGHVPLVVPGIDMVPLEWRAGAPGLEYAVSVAGALDVVDGNGLLLHSEPGVTRTMARIPQVSEDQLVRVHSAAGALFSMDVLSDGNPTQSNYLGILGVTSIRANDMDQDGLSDLMLNHTLSYDNVVLANQDDSENTFNFDDGNWALVQMSGSPGNQGNTARGVFADFDHDGDDDYVLPIEGDDEAHLLPSWFNDQGEYRCVPNVGVTDVIFVNNVWQFTFEIKLPEPAVIDPDATHLDIWMYKQENSGGTLEPTPDAFRSLSIRDESGVNWGNDRRETFLLTDNRVTFQAIYWFVLQVSERDTNGIQRAYAPHLFAVCLDDDIFMDLINIPGAGAAKWFVTENAPGGGHHHHRHHGGGHGHGGYNGPPNGGGTVPLPNLPNSFGGTTGGGL